jgi:hypothetical protein
VDVSGVSGDQGRVVAKTITVDGDDLEAAQMIESGLLPRSRVSWPGDSIQWRPLPDRRCATAGVYLKLIDANLAQISARVNPVWGCPGSTSSRAVDGVFGASGNSKKIEKIMTDKIASDTDVKSEGQI